MNYTYHERTRIDRTPVTRLTDAEVQAVRAKLAADYARHLELMVELQRIMAFTARLEARRRIQAKIAPFAVGEAA